MELTLCRKVNRTMQNQIEEGFLEVKSTLVSRNITVFGRRTSVRLEPEMWRALKEIAKRENCSVHDICSLVHLRKKENTSLTAAIRVFLMLYFKASSTEEGHIKAGHGDFDNMKRRAGVFKSMDGKTISETQVEADNFIYKSQISNLKNMNA